jgi:prophage regulatory protein
MPRNRLTPPARVPTKTGDLFDLAQRQPPILPPPQDDELWSVRTIAAKTGLARSTIYAYVKQGLFPRQRRLGPGRVGWRASEVRHWIATR